MKKFIKDMLSGGTAVSSKRVAGFLSLIIALLCVIYLVIKEGGTQIVSDLIITLLITSTGLLGVSTIANIWKK